MACETLKLESEAVNLIYIRPRQGCGAENLGSSQLLKGWWGRGRGVRLLLLLLVVVLLVVVKMMARFANGGWWEFGVEKRQQSQELVAVLL